MSSQQIKDFVGEEVKRILFPTLTSHGIYLVLVKLHFLSRSHVLDIQTSYQTQLMKLTGYDFQPHRQTLVWSESIIYGKFQRKDKQILLGVYY